MGELSEAIEESEDASENDKNSARDGQTMMIESASKAFDAVVESDAGDPTSRRIGSSGNNNNNNNNAPTDIRREISDLKKNADIANRFIEKGGVSGIKKDNYDLSVAYNEWIKSRNMLHACPEKIRESSIRYVALVNGNAAQHEIQKVYQTKEQLKSECDKAPMKLMETATIYLEVDRRVKENKMAEMNRMPIEGFQYRTNQLTSNDDINTKNGFSDYTENNTNGEDMSSSSALESHDDKSFGGLVSSFFMKKEPFAWYRGNPRNSGITIQNPRLPLYTEQNINTGDGTGILKWSDFYTNCKIQSDPTLIAKCETSMKNKNTYIKAINNLFFEADTLINILYQLNSSGDVNSASNTENAERIKVLKKVVEKQSSEIDIYKQKAHYSYEEYNTLSGVQDTVLFVYYALVIIYAIFFLKDWFMSKISLDIRQISVILLMIFYPRFILQFVIWCLVGLTKIIKILGIKNTEFWW